MNESHSHTVPSLHARLQIVEVVVFLSLLLNLVQGYYALHTHKQMTQIEQQTGARP
jgi:hypothetical protein